MAKEPYLIRRGEEFLALWVLAAAVAGLWYLLKAGWKLLRSLLPSRP